MNYDRNFIDCVESKGYEAVLIKGNIAGRQVAAIVPVRTMIRGENRRNGVSKCEHADKREKIGSRERRPVLRVRAMSAGLSTMSKKSTEGFPSRGSHEKADSTDRSASQSKDQTRGPRRVRDRHTRTVPARKQVFFVEMENEKPRCFEEHRGFWMFGGRRDCDGGVAGE